MRIARLHFTRRRRHGALQIVQSGAGQRTHSHDGVWFIQIRICQVRFVQERPPQKLLDFQPNHVEGLGIDCVGLSEHGDAALHSEQLQNVEVLASLGLDRFVGRDDQQHQVDASHSGQHVADEALVAGDVHKTEMQPLAVLARQIHVGEAQVDGDAAALLFFEPVGIDAGQCLYQRRFPVVDVPGGAYDDRFHSPES